MGSMVSCMSCCKQKDAVDPIFKDSSNRKCRDLPCCILFMLFWVGMIVIAIVGVVSGNPKSLIYGTDYEGNTCGDGSNEDKKRIYYPRISEDLTVYAASGETDLTELKLFGVCMEKCPSSGDVVCTEAGDADLNAVAGSMDNRATTFFGCEPYTAWLADSRCKTITENCWYVPLPSTEYFFHCVWQNVKNENVTEVCSSPPILAGKDLTTLTEEEVAACITVKKYTTTETTTEAQENPVISQLASTAAVFGRLISDLTNTVDVILVCGGLIGFLLGFLWLLLVRAFAKLLVWTTILLANAMLIFATFIAYFKAGLITSETISTYTSAIAAQTGTDITIEAPASLTAATSDGNSEESRWKIFAYMITAVMIIVALLTVVFRKKIKIAIEVIREASRAIGSMYSILFYPIIPVVSLIGLLVYWIFISAYIYSLGDSFTASDALSAADTVSGSTFCNALNASSCDAFERSSYASTPVGDILLAYHFFGLLWTVQFISGVTVVVVAGAIAKWYFTQDKTTFAKENKLPVWNSFKTTIFNHLGSIAFGSLIIAIVQFVRVVLEYLNRQSKSAQDKNKALKFMFACLRCCLWCFEKCIQFITKYAYIFIAVKGDSFLTSAKNSFMLIISEIAQIAIVETVTAFLFLIGKILIVIACTIAGYFWMSQTSDYQAGGDKELESLILPLLLIILLSYAMASSSMSIYNLAIDTILLCFCEDKKINDGVDKPYCMSNELQSILGKKNSEKVNIEVAH